MKPPMNGASNGPVKTVIENTVMAIPRVLLSNMSANTAATTARGQAPNIPIHVSNLLAKILLSDTYRPRIDIAGLSANLYPQPPRLGRLKSRTLK